MLTTALDRLFFLTFPMEDKKKYKDRSAIEATLKGHSEEFGVLVDRYGGRILGLCWRYVGRQQDAEDLTQKTFFDAFSKLHTFDCSRPFWPWLSRIAINNCKDFFKSPKKAEILSDIDHSSHDGIYPVTWDNPEQARFTTERHQILDKALMKLPDKYRKVLVLKDIQELSYAEIEQILDLPLTTLKIRVIRARKKLQVAIKKVLMEKSGNHGQK